MNYDVDDSTIYFDADETLVWSDFTEKKAKAEPKATKAKPPKNPNRKKSQLEKNREAAALIPKRVYLYGARPHDREDERQVLNQFWLAHVLRNKLVEVELKRRDDTSKLLLKLCPRLVEIETEIGQRAEKADLEKGTPASPATGLEAQADEIQAQINDARMRNKSKAPTKSSKELAAQKKVVKDRIAALRAEAKALRADLFKNSEWRDVSRQIETDATDAVKRLRDINPDDESAGLYKLFSTAVDKTIKSCQSFRKGRPPRRRPGHLKNELYSLQIKKGMTIDELLSGTDQHASLTIHAPRRVLCSSCLTTNRVAKKAGGEPPDLSKCPCAVSPTYSKKRTATIKVRIATPRVPKSKRVKGEPAMSRVYATFDFTYHRDLPSDSSIKYIEISRRRVGVDYRWFVHFVLARPSWNPGDLAQSGTVGIDVGWRKTPDGLRIATWAGSDGREGELVLPTWWLQEQSRVNSMQALRKTNFNEAVELLREWLKTQDADALTERLRDARAHLHSWKSERRLANLVRRWKDEKSGLPGEDETFAAMERWRNRDLHLLKFESHLRDQLGEGRRDLYRKFAAMLSRNYATARLESIDLRTFHIERSEGMTEQQKRAKMYVRHAGLSDLVKSITQRMRHTEKVDPTNTSAACNECGSVSYSVKDKAALVRKCSSCHSTFDRDRNAARNILGVNQSPRPQMCPVRGASRPVVTFPLGALARVPRMTYGSPTPNKYRWRTAAKQALELRRTT